MKRNVKQNNTTDDLQIDDDDDIFNSCELRALFLGLFVFLCMFVRRFRIIALQWNEMKCRCLFLISEFPKTSRW